MEGPIGETRHAQGDPGAAGPSQRRFGRLGRLTIVLAAAALIALTWVGVDNAIRAHRREAVARVHTDLANKALVLEEQVRREILVLDQTLRILELEWQRDPAHFDLQAWQRQVVALTDVSLQIFVGDETGTVRTSTRPQIVGTDISQRDYFRHLANLTNDDGRMFIGTLTRGMVTRLWQMNLARRLDRSDGSFAGVIAVSYDMGAMSRFLRESDLGPGAMIAVVGLRDGVLRAVAGTSPSDEDIGISASPLFAALTRAEDGEWSGPSPLDTVDRIHAFHRVPDREVGVVVGIDRAGAMAPSAVWERDARIFGGGVTLVIIAMAGLLLREENAVRCRQEALVRERAILEATLTGMSDGIMMVDADLRLLEWNQHFPEYTGVPQDLLRVGTPMEDILRAQAELGEFGAVDVPAEVERRMALLRAGSAVGTIERPRPGGRMLEIRRNPLPGGGYVTLYTDVTARRETEERLRQAQTLAAIGRLTSGVAHDFNNLLSAISGQAEMLNEYLASQPSLRDRATLILQAAGRGAEMIRRLLAFSRKQTLSPAPVDLNQTVRGATQLLRASLGHGITVRTELAEDLWPALVDPVQIEHVIFNLAINARDAMPEGGTLTFTTANRPIGRHEHLQDAAGPGDYVSVAVSDTGTGMTDEVLRNAFEPFFTTKPPGQGSGLGLSQVYGLATQSGGGVQIESVPGKGTTVRVFFPRATQPADGAASAPAPTTTQVC